MRGTNPRWVIVCFFNRLLFIARHISPFRAVILIIVFIVVISVVIFIAIVVGGAATLVVGEVGTAAGVDRFCASSVRTCRTLVIRIA